MKNALLSDNLPESSLLVSSLRGLFVSLEISQISAIYVG
jgi:hypothetical protein